MLAVPGATAVIRPAWDTVATAPLSELQTMARPVSVPPLASSVTALACAVSTAVIVLGMRVTVTVATGIGVTVTVALPVFPSLVAVIVAVPVLTAVTTPVVGFTVATDGASELHATSRPTSTLLLASRVVALACVV
jgi:hypothetical protein